MAGGWGPPGGEQTSHGGTPGEGDDLLVCVLFSIIYVLCIFVSYICMFLFCFPFFMGFLCVCFSLFFVSIFCFFF